MTAIYHCSIKIISRGKGKSAVAAAAYRSGEKLLNDYDGMLHDFTKKGGVVHTEILLPKNAPREFSDRSTLWNAVEKIEKSKNAQLAREIEIALPNELSEAECIALAKNFAQRTFVDKGMCADVCIHNPSREQENIHAHIMLTMRPFNENGTWGEKQKKEYILDKNGEKIYDKRKRTYKCKSVPTTDWNYRDKAEEWRKAWSDFLNSALEQRDISERVSHLSFERQGKIEKPTIHLGVSATQMERKGIFTVKGDINRKIKAENDRIHYLMKQLKAADEKIAMLKEIPKEESLVDMLLRYWDNGKKFAEVRGHSISNLKKIEKFKDVAHAVAFLQVNHIATISQLKTKSVDTKATLQNVKAEFIPKLSRITELEELLNNYDRYKLNKAVYEKWQSIENPKKKQRFYDEHYGEITLYQTAKNFFKNRMNGGKLTQKAWKSELEELKKSSAMDKAKISKLEDDIAVLETIAVNVERLENYEEKQKSHEKKRSAELE
ncbi:MAG: MobA/MobL family protein [Oscillospiraceae bacterium]|nr:MobA/MobL family protein [Oscillospiraceae bacterium]